MGGATSINAFPLGVVNNYCSGLVASRPTVLRPNLTRVLTRFLAQSHPDFRYTTIQLNKDYSARLHVDGNNYGPSFIMAMGKYTGGELWIHDEAAGDYELEVKEPLRGYPHLKVGCKVRGRLHDINGKWLHFDGTISHMALPFHGNRFSIVYFSRKRFETMKPELIQVLEDLDFRTPKAGDTGLSDRVAGPASESTSRCSDAAVA